MLIREFVKALKQKRDEKIRSVEEALGRGTVSALEGYQRQVGLIKGLRDLDDLINEVTKELESDQDG